MIIIVAAVVVVVVVVPLADVVAVAVMVWLPLLFFL